MTPCLIHWSFHCNKNIKSGSLFRPIAGIGSEPLNYVNSSFNTLKKLLILWNKQTVVAVAAAVDHIDGAVLDVAEHEELMP